MQPLTANKRRRIDHSKVVKGALVAGTVLSLPLASFIELGAKNEAHRGSKMVFTGYLGGWVWDDVARNKGLAAFEGRYDVLLLRVEARGDDNPDYGPTYMAGGAIGLTTRQQIGLVRPYLLGSIAAADANALVGNLAIFGVGVGFTVGHRIGAFAEFRHDHFTAGRGDYSGLLAGLRVGR